MPTFARKPESQGLLLEPGTKAIFGPNFASGVARDFENDQPCEACCSSTHKHCLGTCECPCRGSLSKLKSPKKATDHTAQITIPEVAGTIAIVNEPLRFAGEGALGALPKVRLKTRTRQASSLVFRPTYVPLCLYILLSFLFFMRSSGYLPVYISTPIDLVCPSDLCWVVVAAHHLAE